MLPLNQSTGAPLQHPAPQEEFFDPYYTYTNGIKFGRENMRVLSNPGYYRGYNTLEK